MGDADKLDSQEGQQQLELQVGQQEMAAVEVDVTYSAVMPQDVPAVMAVPVKTAPTGLTVLWQLHLRRASGSPPFSLHQALPADMVGEVEAEVVEI